MIEKRITYMGQPAKHVCDGLCSKAWGTNSRPKVRLSDNEDDIAYLADGELGDAPTNPGTYEGGQAKPLNATGPEHLNKWCVRECERAELSSPGRADEPLAPRDFSQRRYNIRTSDPAVKAGDRRLRIVRLRLELMELEQQEAPPSSDSIQGKIAAILRRRISCVETFAIPAARQGLESLRSQADAIADQIASEVSQYQQAKE